MLQQQLAWPSGQRFRSRSSSCTTQLDQLSLDLTRKFLPYDFEG